MAPTPVAGFATEAGIAGFKDSYDYKVTDPWAVPREYTKPPEIKRGALLQHIREIAKFPELLAKGIPGIEIVKGDKVDVK